MTSIDGQLRQQEGADTRTRATVSKIQGFLQVIPGKSPGRIGANMSKRESSKNGKNNLLMSRTAVFKISFYGG